ncbi:MAG TPA: hypothetical protein VJT09_07155, partial [Pyrinomonadaceae bacterium]|nr:hypothetical protein [Pyrinomonadaceae bacterium]
MSAVATPRQYTDPSVGLVAKSGDNITSRWGFPEWFIVSQTFIPALLFIPGSQVVRLPLRVAPFAISLLALAWRMMNGVKEERPHPARPWLLLAVAYLVLMIFHPTTNTTLAGIAQMLLYLSVMAPLFWVPSLMRGPQHLGRLLILLLICSGVNAAVGVMQVYDPDRWMPPEISRAVAGNRYGRDYYTYVGPDGKRIVRPPGLFDTPGAVAAPGAVAGLLGLVFFLGPIPLWKKALALCFAAAGAIAIYLSNVRTSILILAGMLFVYFVLLLIQRQRAKAIAFGALAVLLFSITLSYSIFIGGKSINERFATLFEDAPVNVYFKAGRGDQLRHGFMV